MYRVVCLQGQIIGWFIRHVFDVALREKKRKLKNEYIWLLVFIFLVEESRKTGGFQLVLWVEINCLSRKKIQLRVILGIIGSYVPIKANTQSVFYTPSKLLDI